MRSIETVLSPNLFDQIECIENKTVVVIDILRATSTITTILENGAKSVIPVKEEKEARQYKKKGYLVGGERGGETIDGFHFGNSPFHYKAEIVKGKDIVLTTTNGTKCIEMSEQAAEVVVGSFLNLQVVIKHLKKTKRDIVLFAAGWKNRVNLEDTLFAGAVAEAFNDANKDDASLLSIAAYKAAKDNLFATLQDSDHFQRLANKGVTKDIEYCCEVDKIDSIGVLQEGKIIAS